MYPNPIKILTLEDYNKNKHNDKFLHEVCFTHGVQGWEPYNKAHCFYSDLKHDFKVSPELQLKAKADYKTRKQEIVNSMGNKLIFVGMGMDFTPSTINHIGNHRIRTYIKNNAGKLCFIEVSASRDKDFLRCDHALINTKKNNSEWCSLNEREEEEKRVYCLESIKGDYIEFTKENVLKLVNDNLNCNFIELEVYSYCLSTEDYTSISKVEK